MIDHVDAELAAKVEAAGLRSVVTDTIMSDIDRAAALAEAVLEQYFARGKRHVSLTIHPITGIPEITEGIDLGALIGDTCVANDSGLR